MRLTGLKTSRGKSNSAWDSDEINYQIRQVSEESGLGLHDLNQKLIVVRSNQVYDLKKEEDVISKVRLDPREKDYQLRQRSEKNCSVTRD